MAKKKQSATSGSSKSKPPKVRVRMYRQGLGDCFLLTFGVGSDVERHMLIDCGTLGASTPPANEMKKVIAHIAKTTDAKNGKGHLTVLAATHEHQDHLSGFNTGADIFADMKVDHVWLAWTENPADKLARKIKVYERDLQLAAEAAVAAALDRGAAVDDASQKAALGARDILGFGGDPDALGADKFAKTVDAAMKFVRDDLVAKPTYHDPGDLVELPEIPGFRFYVLGPPRDEERLGVMGEHGSSHLYGLRAAGIQFAGLDASAAPELDAAERDRCDLEMPFDTHHRVPEARSAELYPAYHDDAAAWRSVGGEWLNAATDLALQLDHMTNNTSLALAIERIADGRVLLFPADAQEGNWLSWHVDKLKWKVPNGNGNGSGGATTEVTAADLLARTVFYKVGHHGSHNATVSDKGLELMTRKDELTAFIPVDRQVALKRNPQGSWKMPAKKLYRRLLECCDGRVVRSDIGWPVAVPKGTRKDHTEFEFVDLAEAKDWKAWGASQKKSSVTFDKGGMFVDYTLD